MAEKIPFTNMVELDDKVNAVKKLFKFMDFESWAEIKTDEDEGYLYIFDKELNGVIDYDDFLMEVEAKLENHEDLESVGLNAEEQFLILNDLETILDIDVEFLL